MLQVQQAIPSVNSPTVNISEPHAEQSLIKRLENAVRTTVFTKRIRVSEFFQDFDRLRSGYITKTQFMRCLDQSLNIKLSAEDSKLLMSIYATKGNMVNYRLFCDAIDQVINPNDLSTDPSTHLHQTAEYLGTERSARPLSPSSDARAADVLAMLQRYYRFHGINVSKCYEDFDKHHVGLVTKSQFYRSFPRPRDLDQAAVDLLAANYADPERPYLCNYLNFHGDVENRGRRLEEGMAKRLQPLPAKPQPPLELSLDEIIEKVRAIVFRNGIRTTEFFKDHDKLRSGLITENHFICGLSMAVGRQAQLSRSEILRLAQHYSAGDGRVVYKHFCDQMDKAYTPPELAKHMNVLVTHPIIPSSLTTKMKPVIPLSPEEQERVNKVVADLRQDVSRRRLMMYPYFKDYDRGKAYSRTMTKSQFNRMLHFLSLEVRAEDLKLLCRQFGEPYSSDVNYPMFVEAVDQDFQHFSKSEDAAPPPRAAARDPRSPLVTQIRALAAAERAPAPPGVDYDALVAAIRRHVLVSRRRVCEYFQDFDPLRSASISTNHFRRGLSALGLSALGKLNMNDAEFECLARHYRDPRRPSNVLWTNFVSDIECVFTEQQQEKTPSLRAPRQEVHQTPAAAGKETEAVAGEKVGKEAGEEDWCGGDAGTRACYDAAMRHMREKSQQRRILTKPCFQDFDRHNNGHVTRAQFQQCMTYLMLAAGETEMAAIEAKFSDDVGFNYVAFLKELQPEPTPQLKYEDLLTERIALNSFRSAPEEATPADIDKVLVTIKTKVWKERIRVLEFMRDYDKLRAGRVLKSLFRRALDMCTIHLKEPELLALELKYESANPDYVDYLRFSDDVESIFVTKGLEKNPQLKPQRFRPPVAADGNKLSGDKEALLTMCMKRLAEKVRKRRMQLFPLFEDYDCVHNGTVSRSQFRRVLSELDLGALVSEREFLLIFEKFEVKVGGKVDSNYIAFCDMIYELAQFERWRP